mgnify:CR=1 FL=1
MIRRRRRNQTSCVVVVVVDVVVIVVVVFWVDYVVVVHETGAEGAMSDHSSQRRIRARSEAMVRSRSSAATAARRVAVRTELYHWNMRLGTPNSRVSSFFRAVVGR